MISTNEQEEFKKNFFLDRPKTKQELKHWIYVFIGLDLPDSNLDGEASNASPMEVVWLSYQNYLNNNGDEHPGYVWLSARDAMKSLSASILAVVLMVFFDATICWLASIEPQSKIALDNVQSFIQRVKPYLTANKKIVESNNARNLEIVDENGKRSLINVLVATMASVNGRHVNCVFTDEVDLLRDRRVLDEVQAVASLIGGQFPLKVYLSTRKFAFSNMNFLLENSEKLGLIVLKWDILDVTEHCPVSRHGEGEKDQTIFVHPEPPLRSFIEKDFAMLPDAERKQYIQLNVYKGCVNCKLVSQCRTRLADRPAKDKGKLWKKIDHTINMFRSMSPDMAAAQLLCRRPSSAGLLYPRFDKDLNALTIPQAYYNFTGTENPSASLADLVMALQEHNIPIYVGGDWGHSGGQAFIVSAIIPNGEFWILDSYCVAGLEFDDILLLGKNIRDKYEPKKWYMDTNMPMFIKTFNKNGMSCAQFDKDVQGGIECVRTQVMDATGKRRLKVIKHDQNNQMFMMFARHHYKLDASGVPTETPDDEEWSHLGDSARYLGQNLFGTRGNRPMMAVSTATSATDHIVKPDVEKMKQQNLNDELKEMVKQANQDLMRGKVSELTGGQTTPTSTVKKNKGIFWSI